MTPSPLGEADDFADARPAVEILCPEASYRKIHAEAGLEVLTKYEPLTTGDEPYPWANETRIAAWVIYVLKKSAMGG